MPLINGQTYYYSIFTYDTNGNYSVAVTASGTPQVTLSPVTILDASGGDAAIQLFWTKSLIADGYQIYYGTEPGVYGPAISVSVGELLDAENPSFLLQTGLSNNVTYWIAISATNSGAESSKSNEVAVVTGVPSIVVQPSNLKAQNGNAAIRLTWDIASPAVDGYHIRYGTTSHIYTGTEATEGPSPILINGNIGTCDITGLTNDTIYFFSIQAFRGTELSAISEEVVGLPQSDLGAFVDGDVIVLQLGSAFNLIGMPVSPPDSSDPNSTMKLRGMLLKTQSNRVFLKDGAKFRNVTASIGTNSSLTGAEAYFVNVPTVPANPGYITVKLAGAPWKV